ncbi:Inositol-1-monophosphatase [Candidatus Protochlamydia amoebophila]|uniref:inositol monophosphatase family protein n=1 Tax=Candidatus Protochlamydia TaxID=282132 RepID=UPI0005AA2877|nr:MULTISPECIES: inositol monophosphatase family protein [Protochlamydia]MBS4162890.1 Inositol-1-monophosphatase [Candidatus Protochlamydia amoebophila]
MNLPLGLSSLALTAKEAALEAAKILKNGFKQSIKVSTKPGRQNYVTEYDNQSENCIISSIKNQFPSHQFLAEESGLSYQIEPEEVLWIIDPLDGTTNFIHHIPIFTISIAAMIKQEIVCGVIYQPFTNELFISEKNQGAYLNGKKLQVSSTKFIKDALISINFPYDVKDHPIFSIEQLREFTLLGASLRNLGSSSLALAYLAAGKLDAFWMNHLYPWDWAAGKLMIEESQGKLTFYPEKENLFTTSTILATNSQLHPKLLKCIKH